MGEGASAGRGTEENRSYDWKNVSWERGLRGGREGVRVANRANEKCARDVGVVSKKSMYSPKDHRARIWENLQNEGNESEPGGRGK